MPMTAYDCNLSTGETEAGILSVQSQPMGEGKEKRKGMGGKKGEGDGKNYWKLKMAKNLKSIELEENN